MREREPRDRAIGVKTTRPRKGCGSNLLIFCFFVFFLSMMRVFLDN